MSTSRPQAASSTHGPPASERSYFEQQREILLREIGTSFEHVLANINKLNRSLEAVIIVGNEFSGVEALWSQFETVMAKDADSKDGEGDGEEVEGQSGITVEDDDGEGEDTQVLEEEVRRREKSGRR